MAWTKSRCTMPSAVASKAQDQWDALVENMRETTLEVIT